MNSGLILVVAIPLAIFIIILLVSLRDVGRDTSSRGSAPQAKLGNLVDKAKQEAVPSSVPVNQPHPSSTALTEHLPIQSGQSGEPAPRYAFDYSGRLWVEKKRRSFFRVLRRPGLPPDEPD